MTYDVAQDQAFVKLKPGPDLVRGERESARARAVTQNHKQAHSQSLSLARAAGLMHRGAEAADLLMAKECVFTSKFPEPP